MKGERDTALKACESAFEANELLRDQVKLVTRERELAVLQVTRTLLLLFCAASILLQHLCQMGRLSVGWRLA